MKRLLISAVMLVFVLSSFAQKIKVISGDIKALTGKTKILLEFVYDDNLKVGKISEDEYIKNKSAEYEKKHPNQGDKWVEMWKGDRKSRFQPKFEELFNKILGPKGISASEKMENYDCKLIIHTYFIEPGFNVGVMKKPSLVSWYAIFQDKDGKELLKLNSINAPGTSFADDFDTGERIKESYAKGAKTLAKYLLKKKVF